MPRPLRSAVLLGIHGACAPSLLRRLLGPPPGSERDSWALGEPDAGLPEAGDSIGPYLLRREIGRGSFARVFLAEQADLADRLVVVKIATRSTREPWLLARARHAHIVEIVSHAEVDDGAFQLICMPFWGGATLADVLAAPSSSSRPGSGPDSSIARGGPARRAGRRLFGRSRGPATGADLLAALDAVGAPEYPSVHPARPAREILAPLSYDRAIAWVIARLAEALDHASGRDVAHGDVKPSNILLSADGNPMLLDFNLARDVTPALDPYGRPIDPGGTLAYMAPERLRALALAGSGRSRASGLIGGRRGRGPLGVARGIRRRAPCPGGGSRRRIGGAGGACLRHLLAGDGVAGGAQRPAAVGGAGAGRPRGGPGRAAGPADLDGPRLCDGPRSPPGAGRWSGTSRPHPAGRSQAGPSCAILGRCLDPDPSRRYRRALELAEDLDRWRTDRPLAYADEPFWGQSVPRWLRVRRRMLIVAAASILALGLATAVLVEVGSNRLLLRNSALSAIGKLAT